MGPFGKLTSKLKGQQKEAQKNGKQCSDSRPDTQEQGQSEKLQVLANSKAEDTLGDHFHTRKGGHSEEKACMKAGGAFDQSDSVSPRVPSRVPEKGTRMLHEPDFKSFDLLAPIHSAAKKGEGTSEERDKCSTDDFVEAPKTVLATHELESLTLFSRGLNPIKTRSGPLYKDALGTESQEPMLESKSFSSSRVEVGNWDAYQGRDTKEFDVEGRKKGEASGGKNLCDGEGHKSAVFTTLQGVDLSSKSLEGKNRRKFKADLQKFERGLSAKRPSDPVIGANLGASKNAATIKVDSFSPTEVSKDPFKPEEMLDSKGPSSLLSYLDHEFDERFGVEATPKPLDVIKEMESPTFHTIAPVFEPRSFKKWPKDIKSFSHELGPRGGRPYDVSRPHSDNDLEELLASLRARFNTAKEEVDADLNLFAADLVEILDRNVDSFPQWKENVEDLLLLARKCTLLSPVDFRRECESIVHDLDEQRQELPMGLLKQLHTRMLFILTRCTRLLQFQKETSPEEEGLHKVQQCLKGVPSVERTLTFTGKRGKTAGTTRKLLPEVLEQSARNDVGLPKLKISKQPRKPRFGLGKGKSRNEHLCSPKVTQADLSSMIDSKKSSVDIPESFEATGDYNVVLSKVSKTYGEVSSTQLQERWEPATGKLADVDTQMESPSKLHLQNHWTDSEREEPESVICRICEEEVPTSLLEPHSLRCRFADYCDVQGLNLDERIQMIADNLDVIADLNMPKSNQAGAEDSPDRMRPCRSNLHEGFDNAFPQSNDVQGKALEARYEDMCISDSASIDDLRGPSLINFKRHLGYKSDQGVASSSAGSGTPRSTLNTPRTSQLDLLYAERNSFAELEDTSEIYELAGIARNIANKSLLEEGALEMLGSCLEELHELLARNKVEALTVDTFGRRIEKLLRQKIYMINGTIDHKKTDSMGSLFEDDGMSTDDGVHSFKSTPTHSSYDDRITIEDFEILKLISRGAFGRVFLARKRTTGDLFAIKVLRKIDMIRKNAVENILAERDILISVCNPFVVRFFYSFTCRDNLYLVMEYLNGGDLYSMLRNLGCLTEGVARVYIAELVLALEYLHSLGVVHRDLKPDNILIARDGHIKLTDFGLSKVGLIDSTDDLSGPVANSPVLMDDIVYGNDEEHAVQREHRKERSAVGTPDYLAPEILLGTEHGYTADWWSVGVILFECLTGVPPFNAEHPQIIFDNILNRKIPWPQGPEEMSYDAKDLIDKLLTEDPNERLGAKGASEVKSHVFFKDISWDSQARQKAAFVPSPESVEDTSYFTSRYLEAYAHTSQVFGDSSDCSTSCSSSNSLRVIMNEGDDECGDLAELERRPSVEQTFNKFSFKNLSQLVSMNYDLLSQTGRDSSKGHSRNQSAS